MKILLFDTETNGVTFDRSINSISTIKAELTDSGLEKISEKSRYYFIKPGEKPFQNAINIHGLTEEVIASKRGDNCDYPKYSHEDSFFYDELSDVDVLIAHNASFDTAFFPKIKKLYPKLKIFCSMKATTNLCKIKGMTKSGKPRKGYKWPKLSELSNFLNVCHDRKDLHGSAYDTHLLFEIIKEMFNNKKYKYILDEVIKK